MQVHYFKNLDILRFVAAWMVVISHGYEAWLGYYYPTLRFPENSKLITQAGTYISNFNFGVEVFFLLSGFLITYLLLIEKSTHQTISIKNFWIRRILRIWPIYFLVILITPFLIPWIGVASPDYLPQIFFYSNYDTILKVNWQFPFAHFWSIAIEEQFYFIWPLILLVFPINKLKYIFVFIILGSMFSRYYFFQNSDHVWMHLQLNTLCRVDTLVIGGAIALFLFEKKRNFKVPIWLFLISVITILTLFYYGSYTTISNLNEAIFKKYIYLLPLIFILVFCLKESKKSAGIIVRLLRYLGKISYGIYIFHNILILIIIKRILFNNNLDNDWYFVIVYPLSVVAISILTYEFIEKPILKLKRHFSFYN